MLQQMGANLDDAPGKDTEHPWRVGTHRGQRGHLGQQVAGVIGFGLTAHTDHPQGRHRQDQPLSLGPLRIGHLGVVPLPASSFEIFEPLLDPPRRRYQMTSLVCGGRSVSSRQGCPEPSSQRASKVPVTGCPLKPCTDPCQAVPGRGTTAVSGCQAEPRRNGNSPPN
jgi:hypothetical protein